MLLFSDIIADFPIIFEAIKMTGKYFFSYSLGPGYMCTQGIQAVPTGGIKPPISGILKSMVFHDSVQFAPQNHKNPQLYLW